MTHTPEPINAPTSPYQSRLLNFLNRQQILWRDRVGLARRRVQMTLVWSSQILLYPLYLLTQFGRGLTLRLEAVMAPTVPSPLPTVTTSDRPIHNTLRALEQFNTTSEVTPMIAELPAVTIQGIASDRDAQQLVLITTTNQIRQLPSPQQQHQLQQQIRWELAEAAHQRYLLKVQANQYRIPLQLTQAPDVLLPIRRFWQLMRWLQMSPIAIAANVFGEAEYELSSFVPALPVATEVPHLGPVERHQTISMHQLDQTLVKLESQQQQIHQKLTQWWQHHGHSRRINFTNLQQNLRLRLNILLGKSAIVHQAQDNTDQEDQSAWLTWEDLTDHSRDLGAAYIPPEAALIEAEMILDLPFTEPVAEVMPESEIPSKASYSPPQLTPASPYELRQKSQPAAPEYQPDWIEVKSESVGYETHFLEQVLKIFDRAMFIIEETVLAIWRWIRQHLLPHD